jgi:hypothetical protein
MRKYCVILDAHELLTGSAPKGGNENGIYSSY